ncbi:MAG: STAS domain-containing protein, partial [Pyrinomonadaceae bacterium]
ELTVGGGMELLLERVRARLAAGSRSFVINMSECRRADSSGLGELVTCLVTATRHGATLRLAAVPSHIQGLMRLANLHKIFEISETDEAALKSAT